jgi:DNA-binding IclR family transcriptional regulator
MISKTTDKRYEALWTLRPLADTREHLRSRINQKMTTLCAATGCTIEWYEPGDEGMKLILQTHPETEVRVLVRPGYIRRWDGEFEAVNRLGYSFFNDAPRPVGLSLHVENGVIKKIPHAQAARMIAECRSSKTASDLAFNRNSVRRHAIAVFHPDESIFHGILAIAEVFRFTAPPSPSTFINRLAEAIASL